MVLDADTGNPVPNALVKWKTPAGIQQVKTDSLGIVTVENTDMPSYTISKDYYLEYKNDSIYYEKGKEGYEIITLMPDSVSPYKLKSAIYSKNVLGETESQDILKGTKTIRPSIDLDDVDVENFDINVKAVAEEKATKYAIYQDGKKIAESADGNFKNLSVRDFYADTPVEVRVYRKESDLNYLETKINLVVEKAEINTESSYKLAGDGLTVTIPEDTNIPLLGGAEIEVAFPDLPFELVISEDKVHVGYNVHLYEGDSSAPPKNATKEEKLKWKEKVKENIEEVQKAFSNVKKTHGLMKADRG